MCKDTDKTRLCIHKNQGQVRLNGRRVISTHEGQFKKKQLKKTVFC